MSTTAIKCHVCGSHFSADAGDVDPVTNQGFCDRCLNAIPLTGGTVIRLFDVLDHVPGNRRRSTFVAKRLTPSGETMRASQERKRAQSKLFERVSSKPRPNGKVSPLARRTFRHRDAYCALLDLRVSATYDVLKEIDAPDSDSQEPDFWTFDDTWSDDRPAMLFAIARAARIDPRALVEMVEPDTSPEEPGVTFITAVNASEAEAHGFLVGCQDRVRRTAPFEVTIH